MSAQRIDLDSFLEMADDYLNLGTSVQQQMRTAYEADGDFDGLNRNAMKKFGAFLNKHFPDDSLTEALNEAVKGES